MAQEDRSCRSEIIAVIGTGRSGTSLATKMLDILGVYLGPEEHFMEPTRANPRGYYELKPVFELNNGILALLGGNCWEPPVFDEAWQRSLRLAKHRVAAGALIDRFFGKQGTWAFKDPRLCWLMPFWRELLPSEPSYVFAIRNPLDVARSLERAEGLAFGRAITYWHKATVSALEQTAGGKTLFVFYEDMMTNRQRELERMASFINRKDLAKSPKVSAKVRSFVEEKLHRNRTSALEVIEHPDLPFETKALYMALRAQVGSDAGESGPGKYELNKDLELFGRLSLDETSRKRKAMAGRIEPLSAGCREAGEKSAGVSIIIPVYNRLEHTERCIDSIYRNTPLEKVAEVVVVDNGSTDGTAGKVRAEAAQRRGLMYISNPENLGFSIACNIGARASTGAGLLFLNNDTEVEPGWLEPLLDVMDSDPKVGACSGKMLYPDRTIQHAGVMVFDDQDGVPGTAVRSFGGEPDAHVPGAHSRVYPDSKVVVFRGGGIRSGVFQRIRGC